jgi:glutathione S-transferase
MNPAPLFKVLTFTITPLFPMAEQKRTLYAFHGRSPSNPIKIAILLEELGLDYSVSSLSVCSHSLIFHYNTKTAHVQRDANEHKNPEHTARHPNAKVPVLLDENGMTTWETMAISQYLIEEYDEKCIFSR